MEVIIVANEAEVGRVAAGRVVSDLSGTTTPVLGLATGSSPLSLYADLARRVREGEIDFTHALGFALDEYVGIDPTHPESYRAVIERTVIGPLGFAPDRVQVPDGGAEDVYAAAAAYDADIEAAGGVDVQILGLGSNGHIGFNEPFSSFASRTHVELLAATTRSDNARFFDSIDDVPTHCITQGLGTIMDARSLVMVVVGEGKADAVAAMIEGPVAASMPASMLQFHANCTIVLDEAAAAKLEHHETFRVRAAR